MRISDWSSDVCSSDLNRNRSQGGLGIGLTLVKRLAELHGGSIEMFSDGHGKGSRFTVRLPAVEPRNAERVAASGGGDPDLAHVHALIVDDKDRKSTRLNSSH